MHAIIDSTPEIIPARELVIPRLDNGIIDGTHAPLVQVAGAGKRALVRTGASGTLTLAYPRTMKLAPEAVTEYAVNGERTLAKAEFNVVGIARPRMTVTAVVSEKAPAKARKAKAAPAPKAEALDLEALAAAVAKVLASV